MMRLSVSNVAVGYDPQHPLQTGITFEAKGGDVFCILGPNGCGKTTLFRSIVGVQPLLEGKVLVDDEDITGWSADRIAHVAAYVPQKNRLEFPYKVKDIVMLGRFIHVLGRFSMPGREDYAIVENALDMLGIYHLRNRFYTDLSGGELQMTMIARALAQEPQILFLDEPTSALDFGAASTVIKSIRHLASLGYTVVMTTHSPNHAFLCNAKVALLRADGPATVGDARDVITEPNMKRSYGAHVKAVEYVDRQGKVMRVCVPNM
ncbi:MAG: ABC transporter ATP-binding protein [Coriobacteriales bacterium]|jgi:iron complex transport system ATP-binding protein